MLGRIAPSLTLAPSLRPARSLSRFLPFLPLHDLPWPIVNCLDRPAELWQQFVYDREAEEDCVDLGC